MLTALAVLFLLGAAAGPLPSAARQDGSGARGASEEARVLPDTEALLQELSALVEADAGDGQTQSLLEIIQEHQLDEGLDEGDLSEFQTVFAGTLHDLIAQGDSVDLQTVMSRLSGAGADHDGVSAQDSSNSPSDPNTAPAARPSQDNSLGEMLGNFFGDISSTLKQSGSSLSAMLSGAASSLSTPTVTLAMPQKSQPSHTAETVSGCLWPRFKPVDGLRRPLPTVMEEAMSLPEVIRTFSNAKNADPHSERLIAWLKSGGSTVNSLGIRKHAVGFVRSRDENKKSRTIVSSVLKLAPHADLRRCKEQCSSSQSTPHTCPAGLTRPEGQNYDCRSHSRNDWYQR